MNSGAMAALIGSGILDLASRPTGAGPRQMVDPFDYYVPGSSHRAGRSFQPTLSYESTAEARKRKKSERQRKRDQRRKRR